MLEKGNKTFIDSLTATQTPADTGGHMLRHATGNRGRSIKGKSRNQLQMLCDTTTGIVEKKLPADKSFLKTNVSHTLAGQQQKMYIFNVQTHNSHKNFSFIESKQIL